MNMLEAFSKEFVSLYGVKESADRHELKSNTRSNIYSSPVLISDSWVKPENAAAFSLVFYCPKPECTV